MGGGGLEVGWGGEGIWRKPHQLFKRDTEIKTESNHPKHPPRICFSFWINFNLKEEIYGNLSFAMP